MTIITIDGLNTQIGRAISLYGAYLIRDTLDNYSFIGLSRGESDGNHFDLTLPRDKDTEVEFESSKIIIKYKIKSEEPISYDNGMHGFYTEIELNGSSKDVLVKFMDSAIIYTRELMYNRKNVKDKITCFIFDKLWITYNKILKRRMDTVYLRDNLLETIIDDVKKFQLPETAEKYHLLGRPYKRNYLFEGPPGTGKTTIICTIASELDMSIGILNFNNNIDDNTFVRALQKLPDNCILVLEDIDCLFESRKSLDDHKNMITFGGLLNTLDGLMHKDKLLIFMTTNYKDKLDNALIRPGRIDKVYTFDFMDKGQIMKMFLKYFPDKESEFKEFYGILVKKNLVKNITPAIMQEYFFAKLEDQRYKEDTDLLKSILKEHINNDKKYEDMFN